MYIRTKICIKHLNVDIQHRPSNNFTNISKSGVQILVHQPRPKIVNYLNFHITLNNNFMPQNVSKFLFHGHVLLQFF